MAMTEQEKAAIASLVAELRAAKKTQEQATKKSKRLQKEAKDALTEEARASADVASIRNRLKNLAEVPE
jgi:hypothetical protein